MSLAQRKESPANETKENEPEAASDSESVEELTLRTTNEEGESIAVSGPVTAGLPLADFPPPLVLSLESMSPRMRTDLQVQKGANRIFQVTNPASGRAFQLYDFEITVARMLNGRRTISEIIEGANRIGIPVNFETIKKFIRQLQIYGFLQDEVAPAQAPAQPPPAREVWSNETREMFRSAVRIMRQGHLEEAKSYFEAILETQPDLPEVLEMMALLEERMTARKNESELPYEAHAGEPEAEEAAPQAPPAVDPQDLKDELEERYQAKRLARRKRLRTWSIVGAVVVVSALVPIERTVSAPGLLIPAQKVAVRAYNEGVVQEVLVHEGDWVEAGAPLAKMATAGLEKMLERRDAEVEQARVELELAKRGARREEVERARAIWKGRQRTLTLAQRTLARTRELARRQLVSREELSAAESEVASRSAETAEAAAEYNLIRAGSRPEEIEKRQAELRARSVDRDLVKAQLAGSTLIAPIAGVITTANLKEKQSSLLAAGAVFCEVEDPRTMKVAVYVPESELGTVEVGMPATLKANSLPDRVFTGTVSFISPVVEEKDAERVFRVESSVSNPDAALRSNLGAFVKIEVGKHSILRVVTHPLVRWFRLKFFV